MCEISGQLYLFTYIVKPFELRFWLKELSSQYELIIYSVLPLELVNNVLNVIGKICNYPIENYISRILSYEDVTFLDDFAVKDLSLLQRGRLIYGSNGKSEIAILDGATSALKIEDMFERNLIKIPIVPQSNTNVKGIDCSANCLNNTEDEVNQIVDKPSKKFSSSFGG